MTAFDSTPVWAAHKNFAVLVFKHYGWIAGWILTYLDPKNLSVGQKQLFQAPPRQSLNTLILQMTVQLNFEAFIVFQGFLKHQGWITGEILTYLDPKNLTLGQK